MYHIAICDSDKSFVSYIKKFLLQAGGEMEIKLKIYEYRSGEALIQSLEKNIYYDLLMADVRMEGMDGYAAAGIFRKKFPHAVLVVCSELRPSVQVFKVKPFRYLLKWSRETELLHEIKEILQEVERVCQEPFLFRHYRHNLVKVKVKNILYIENAKRGSKIVIHPKSDDAWDGELLLIDDKLSELEGFLDNDFAFPHSSYIVNLNYVKKLGKNEVYLDNGEILSVSRKYHKKFREALEESASKWSHNYGSVENWKSDR